MEWCCAKAKSSTVIDVGCEPNGTPAFFLSADSNTCYQDEIIEYCPFCGKELKELLT
jgi:hypothetical protein